MVTGSWQPSAEFETLAARAALLARLRAFFQLRSVMEVEVPILGASTVTDTHLSALSTHFKESQLFLQTSPEFFLKRLLASGCGSIYSLSKAFRNDESGRRHNPEFTLLEWYRLDHDDHQLMREVLELFEYLEPGLEYEKVTYEDLFLRYLSVDPHQVSLNELIALGNKHIDLHADVADRDTWLELLFSHIIEPNLQGLTLVYEYPKSQAALARVDQNESGVMVARRFEVYWRGVELANGYWELQDPEEQKRRFSKDLLSRADLGLDQPAIDKKFLAALEHGLPDCAGVALGVDRLMMCMLRKDSIEDVISFPYSRL